MKVFIKESATAETLSIIDPKTGVNYVADFIGNTGALADGQFVWDEERDTYVCDQKTFDWWSSVITAQQALDYRTRELINEHGPKAVHDVIHAAGGVDLEDHAANVNRALDEAFGTEGA